MRRNKKNIQRPKRRHLMSLGPFFSFSLPPRIPLSRSVIVPSLGLVIPVVHSCHPMVFELHLFPPCEQLLAAVVLGAGGCVSRCRGIEAAASLEHT
jgi:hypothetical protein